MDIFAPETTATVLLPFVEPMGSIVTPTALSYRILDEFGAEVLPATSITDFDAAKGQYSLVVTSDQNTLAIGAISGYRRIELTITTFLGVYVVTKDYILEALTRLVPGKNSLQTFEQAILMVRGYLGTLTGWNIATDDQRKSAMLQAYSQLAGFPFAFQYVIPPKPCTDTTGLLSDFADATALATLVPTQLSAFQKAQIVQADYLLGGNQIERDINDGLQSTTIGEVSQFYKSRPSISVTLCRAALQYVGRYRNWSLAIGRA